MHFKTKWNLPDEHVEGVTDRRQREGFIWLIFGEKEYASSKPTA